MTSKIDRQVKSTGGVFEVPCTYKLKLLREVLTWIGSLCVGVIFALLISIFIFQPTKVLGNSMEPTLQNNHRIYISKLPRAVDYKPNYGDIVIIDSRVHRKRTLIDDFVDSPLYQWVTHDEDHNIWIKRVIGKPGDVIEFRHKFRHSLVYRNGQLLQEDYTLGTDDHTPDQKIVVQEGTIFVMGDNRNNSRDSREIGCIPIDHVLGVKLFN